MKEAIKRRKRRLIRPKRVDHLLIRTSAGIRVTLGHVSQLYAASENCERVWEVPREDLDRAEACPKGFAPEISSVFRDDEMISATVVRRAVVTGR
jgi:hypothetical protein